MDCSWTISESQNNRLHIDNESSIPKAHAVFGDNITFS